MVAAAIVDDLAAPTGLLAARRSAPAAHAGRWEFPGGKVEPGEAPLAALRRELREELGVAVAVGAEIVGPDDGAWILSARYIMRLWFARITAGSPAPLAEHDRIEWLPFDRVRAVPWLDADVRIVGAVARLVAIQ